MPVKSVNIKTGYPTAERAMLRLSQELRIAGANRVRALKIIHGYGSTGSGGAIRAAARRLLCERRARGQIRAFIPGEGFNAFFAAARAAVAGLPELKKDIDYGRQNDGVTIVLL